MGASLAAKVQEAMGGVKAPVLVWDWVEEVVPA